YRLTVEKGVFETLQQTIGSITADRRLQLLLIAFAFGAFFEGASGFGTPIAGLASVTGLDPYLLGAMVGRQLPFFSLIVPFWLIWTFAGRRGMLQIWPAILVCGLSFAIPQFLISNFINPWIVDVGASLISMACLIGFLEIWQPKELWLSPALRSRDDSASSAPPVSPPKTETLSTAAVLRSLLTWIIVCVILLIWGTGWFKSLVNPIFTLNYPVAGLH